MAGSRENELADIIKYAADVLSSSGADHIYIGFKNAENARAEKKINGSMPLRFSHNMIKMQKNIEMSALESEIRLRPVMPEDAELFRIMYNDAFRYVNNAQYYTPAYAESLFGKEDCQLHFFLSQNEIVGFCICIPYADHILIDAIGIKKEYRGKGLARSSMHALYAEILNAGMQKAELLVSSANIAAVNLYAKEGFKTQAICSYWFNLQHAFTF